MIEDIDCSVNLPGRNGHVPTFGHDDHKPEQVSILELYDLLLIYVIIF